MYRYLIFLIAGYFIIPGYCFGKSCQLTGNLSNSIDKIVYLKSFYGIKTTLIDSAALDKKGNFSFCPRQPYPTGFYRLQFNDTNYFDLILTPAEKVKLKFPSTKFNDVDILSSLENKLLFEVIGRRKQLNIEINKIIIEASYLDKNDSYYTSLIQKKDSINEVFYKLLNDKISSNPNTFFSKTSVALLPFDKSLSKDLVFNSIDFSNPDLIRTTLLPNQYMKYLENYVQYDEDGFKKAIDLILSKANANEEVYNLSLEFLLELFNKVGPEVIEEYIIENYYLKNSCSILQNNDLQKKAEQYKAISLGSKVPELLLPDTTGKIKPLSESIFKNRLTIIYFWSSHCDFCEEALPDIKRIYEEYKNKGLEIYGISLDTDPFELKKHLQNNNIKWITVSDLKGWDSEAVKQLLVNRTPYFYLVDREGKIISKGKKETVLEKITEILN